MRSAYNTHLTEEEARGMVSHLRPDSGYALPLREVMVRTRAKGLSVEAFFKKFGSKTQTGIELSVT